MAARHESRSSTRGHRAHFATLLAIVALVASGCSLFTFGSDSDGQLGRNSNQPALPVNVSSDRGYSVIAVGEDHTCAAAVGSGYYCWGQNGSGQLGTNDSSARDTPTYAGIETTVVSIGLGDRHGCALSAAGNLSCVGRNDAGQLGLGNNVNRSTPGTVAFSTAAMVDAGREHTCAVKTNGQLWCWGSNAFGQLGIGGTTNQNTPQRVGTGSNWAAVSTGDIHTCATKTNGQLWCWGHNNTGKLGIGNTANRSTPVRVGTAGNWATPSAGGSHTCATKTNGQLWCWGNNDKGQLGTDDPPNQYTTPQRVGTGTNWNTVDLGNKHTCAIRTNGQLWCWGVNENGELGIGPGPNSFDPVRVGSRSDWVTIAAARNHTCGTAADLHALCWGDESKAIGNGGVAEAPTPANITTDGRWEQISAGGSQSCGIVWSAELWCWGNNNFGQLGMASGPDRDVAARVPTPSAEAGWSQVAVGDRHVCAIALSDRLYCWGRNSSGQLGIGTYFDQTSPVLIDPVATWQSVGAGYSHTCGVRTSGAMQCWGSNAHGQLGNGTTGGNSPTAQNVLVYSDWDSVELGGDHTCGRRSPVRVYCWGKNLQGQLGLGNTTSTNVPTGSGEAASEFTVGLNFTCTTYVGYVKCTGENIAGQLGLGDYVQRNTLTAIPALTGWSFIEAGYFHTCGLRDGGELWCWGINNEGQIGQTSSANQPSPVQVSSSLGFSSDWTDIAAGGLHTMAIEE